MRCFCWHPIRFILFLPPSSHVHARSCFAHDIFDRIDEPHLRQLFLPFENEAFTIPPEMQGPLTHLFDLILLECAGAADMTLLLKYTTAYLTHLYRFGKRNHRVAGAEDHRLVKLFQLMQMHYRQEKSAAFYAREIGLTPKRVNELLRDKMKTTVSKLLYRLMLIEAKRELYHRQHSVKEIAYGLGFSDQSYFCPFLQKTDRPYPGRVPRRCSLTDEVSGADVQIVLTFGQIVRADRIRFSDICNINFAYAKYGPTTRY